MMTRWQAVQWCGTPIRLRDGEWLSSEKFSWGLLRYMDGAERAERLAMAQPQKRVEGAGTATGGKGKGRHRIVIDNLSTTVTLRVDTDSIRAESHRIMRYSLYMIWYLQEIPRDGGIEFPAETSNRRISDHCVLCSHYLHHEDFMYGSCNRQDPPPLPPSFMLTIMLTTMRRVSGALHLNKR